MNPDYTYLPVHSGPLPHPWGAPPPEKRKKKKEEKKEEEERKRKERRVSVVHIFTGAWRMVKLAFVSPLEKSESFPLTPSFPIPRQKPSIVESFIPSPLAQF